MHAPHKYNACIQIWRTRIFKYESQVHNLYAYLDLQGDIKTSQSKSIVQ